MQLMQRQLRPGFAAASQPLRGRPWVARLFDLPPLGELRARLIAFGGLRLERVRDLAPPRPRHGDEWRAWLGRPARSS